jgi:hypothetical protein
MEKTKLRLAIRLQEISHELAERAEAGEFSDYESEHATPKIVLVGCLNAIYKTATNLKRGKMAYDLAREVMEGKWDETKEESEEWFQREGKNLLNL